MESYRTEIVNLKKSIADKDNLLERSKEMLKMAAEREEDLLREASIYLYNVIFTLTESAILLENFFFGYTVFFVTKTIFIKWQILMFSRLILFCALVFILLKK